ncbi:hypothetical protein [Alicyclobacillus sp. SO9]|uniref:hypothetical protein n=1 Tax=Alicyclobacillus sp. SO9 TaxID=2665646 RepID=UPI0018E811A5|nr:hypothetical protein [Alicyclobacillus sp. SO9]QQE80879.1 hypothetical protein GI364_11140 [Alicyclobacillus sp. SO9]
MSSEKVKKSIFKRWWFWVLAVILIIIIASAAAGGAANSSNAAASQPTMSNGTTHPAGKASTSKNATGTKKSNSSSPDFTIKVTGTANTKFSGDIDVVASNGSSNSETKSGAVPQTYTVKKGAEVSVVLQKSGTTGTLKVEILHQGKLVKESSTKAQYGAVSVSSPLY